MKIHSKIIGVVTAILFLLTAFTGALASNDVAVISPSGAAAYSSSSLSGKSIKLKGYTIVNLKGTSDGAAKISYNGHTYYVDVDLMASFDSSKAEVKQFAKDTKVYQYPSTSSKSVKVKKGQEVNLIAVRGKAALIEKGGNYAYVPTSALTDVEKKPQVTYEKYEAVVTKDSLKVYAKASESGKKLGQMSEDTRVTVTAYTDSWALIKAGGKEGYCLLSGLKRYVPTIDEIFESSASNETKIFQYLTYIDGYSTAAACGILANLKSESGFRPEAYNSSSGSYGICQWTGGRYTSLQSYCQDRELDYTTLKAQCLYLSHELKNKYSSVSSYLRSVPNSAQGAYDAGYHWCYYYEVPANRTGSSEKRGAMAQEDYWPKYD